MSYYGNSTTGADQGQDIAPDDPVAWEYPFFECETPACGRLSEGEVEYREVDGIGWYYCLACGEITTRIANASDEHEYLAAQAEDDRAGDDDDLPI